MSLSFFRINPFSLVFKMPSLEGFSRIFTSSFDETTLAMNEWMNYRIPSSSHICPIWTFRKSSSHQVPARDFRSDGGASERQFYVFIDLQFSAELFLYVHRIIELQVDSPINRPLDQASFVSFGPLLDHGLVLILKSNFCIFPGKLDRADIRLIPHKTQWSWTTFRSQIFFRDNYVEGLNSRIQMGMITLVRR